jgi:Ca2+-transporting ATPase
MLAAIFLTATRFGMPSADIRELTFLSLVAAIIALILVNRSFSTSLKEAFTRNNPTLRYVLGAIVAVLGLTLVIPAFRTLLKFGQPDWTHAAAALVAGGFVLVVLEAIKPYANRQMEAPRAD